MNKLSLIHRMNKKDKNFGIILNSEQEVFIKRHLNDLKELCPSSAKLKLSFKLKRGQVKGILNINSFNKNFYSIKNADGPIETFILLKEDIESQLLDWKRKRFSDSLFIQFSPDINNDVNFA